MIRVLLSILGLQVAVSLALGAAFLATLGLQAGVSALLGGAIAVVPAAYSAWCVIRARNASAHSILRAHYAAEFGKLALTFVLFGGTFALVREVSALPLIAAYIATLAVYWAALVMVDRV
ncbi:MAG TPA: ATP synthase subunit I [Burkholderiales bacterium]|nr:ATP synthase subunit I [Burkholderiales bacterium]